MLDKTTPNLISMWTYQTLPEPVVTKVHDGGPFIHYISSREGIFCQNMRMNETRTHFKNIMPFLLDLMIYYDRMVRDVRGKFLIHFEYGKRKSLVVCNSSNKREIGSSLSHSSLGEHAGTLASTSIANLTYKALFFSFQKKKIPLGHP